MNQRMLARSRGGFTTCLVLRVDANGTTTLANAGHLAPYLDGRELPIENGLPLGLAESSTYPESTGRLENGATLTLMTDGVVEARARNGELFGFDRTASIATLRAEHIANTATAFGQEDDITVVTIARVAVGQESLIATAAPAPLTASP
jgi:serine phosphatase RsbU (regulator of sigma subunit)